MGVGELPWLVVHGEAVQIAAVGMAALVALVLALRLPRAARTRAGGARKRLGPARPRLAASDVGAQTTLAGTLHLRGADAGGRIVVATLGEEAAACAPREGALVLRTRDGDELPLVGDVRVVAGSRETRRAMPRDRLRTLVGHLEGDLPELAEVRALRDGDRVLARGLVARVPPPGEPSGARAYREGAAAPLALTATAGEGGAVEIAHARAPRALTREPARALIAAAGGALAIGASLAVVGFACLATGTPRGRVLACATPSRGPALAELRAGVDLAHDVTVARVREAAALDHLRGACKEAAELLVRHHQSREAREVARDCRLPRFEAHAWLEHGHVTFAAGSMEEADEATSPRSRAPTFLEASTQIAAGRWNEAARSLRFLAAVTRAANDEDSNALRDELRCIAASAERLGGGEASVDPSCTLEAAEVARGPLDPRDLPWREELFGAAGGAAPPPPLAPSPLRYTLLLERGGPGVPYRSLPAAGGRSLRLFFDPRNAVHEIPPALAASALAKLGGLPGRPAAAQRAALELHLAHVAAYFGDLGEARAHVARARTDAGVACEGRRPPPRPDYFFENVDGRPVEPPPPPVSDPRTMDDDALAARDGLILEREADKLAMAIDVRDSATASSPSWGAVRDLDTSLLGEIAEWKRTGSAEAFLSVRSRLPAREAAWKRIAENDPFGLVRDLEARGDRGRGVVDLLGGERGAYDELTRWVRATFPPITRDVLTVQDVAEHLAMRHVAARAAHAQDIVDETWGALANLRQAFGRRDRALLLAHLDEVAHRPRHGPPAP